MDWQPIETAPQNGKLILVFSRDGRAENALFMTMAFWVPRNETVIGVYSNEPISGAWASPWGDEIGFTPTHWMPLPEPPEVAV
jgi:hypothetical protein